MLLTMNWALTALTSSDTLNFDRMFLPSILNRSIPRLVLCCGYFLADSIQASPTERISPVNCGSLVAEKECVIAEPSTGNSLDSPGPWDSARRKFSFCSRCVVPRDSQKLVFRY